MTIAAVGPIALSDGRVRVVIEHVTPCVDGGRFAAKRVVDEIVKDREERNDALCEQVVATCFGSQDYVEGRRAFMEKRKAVFVGR